MIRVLQVDPPDDPEYRDPFVLLSDGNIQIWVFADEFNNKIGDKYQYPYMTLFPLLEGDVEIQKGKVFAVKALSDIQYSYDLYGQINENWKLKVGEFVIDSGEENYEGFKRGDFVHFRCDRVDLIDFNKFI